MSFHIFIHALYKSLLFLLSGSLIHNQSNYQSIFRMKINHFSIKTSFLLLLCVLMLSLAKEGIIHCLHFFISSFLMFSLSLVSSVFTTIYSIKILVYCFLFFYYSLQLPSTIINYWFSISIIVPVFTLSSLCIDESLSLCFLLNYWLFESAALLCIDSTEINFSIIVWIAHFYAIVFVFLYSAFIYSFIKIPFNWRKGYAQRYSLILLFFKDSFSSGQTFFIPLFQDCSLICSSYFFKGPIHCIEVLNSYCYSYYHSHYLSNIQFLSFSRDRSFKIYSFVHSNNILVLSFTLLYMW